MGDYDWVLIDWLNFLTTGNVFLPKTFLRMITNWRVRVQSTSSEFLYSQTLPESEQNSMEIKFVWHQSNPIQTLPHLWDLLLFIASPLDLSFSPRENKLVWYQFNPQIPETPSWSHFLALYFVLVTNKQGKWSLWEIFWWQMMVLQRVCLKGSWLTDNVWSPDLFPILVRSYQAVGPRFIAGAEHHFHFVFQ